MVLMRRLAPCLKTRKRCGRLKLPRPPTLFPVRPNMIHPGIARRVVAKRVPPALSYRDVKQFFVSPLEKAKPEELELSWMLLGESGCVIQKAGAALSKDRDHGVGNVSLCLDGQTEPIGKCSPLNELRNGLCQAIRRNQFALVLCELL